MKKSYWLIFSVILLSCSRDEPIRVRGIVENGTGRIYLDEQGLVKVVKIDSARLRRNGMFTLKDRIAVPTFYNLHMGDQRIIPLLLQPGETAEITTDVTGFAREYEVTGTEESLGLKMLNERLAKTRKSMDSLRILFEENTDAGEEVLNGLQSAYEEVARSQRRYSTQFVLEHMNSLASIYALYQKFDNDNFIFNSNRDIQLFKITSMALDTLYPESEYVKSIKRDAAQLEMELQSRNLQRVMESLPSSIPDIRLPDPRGDTIALSSIKNKVVLLSFWASWNQESVSLNQEFIRLYEKYHEGGMEIYQVSFDTELRPWMEAIRYDELPWINVSELSFPKSRVAAQYNVSEIPAYFLIDRQGGIVGKNLDLIALDRKISELINQN